MSRNTILEAATARKELKRRIAKQDFVNQATEICIALQELRLDANRLCFIIIEACAPYTDDLAWHVIWTPVVKVKHFSATSKQ